MNFKLMPLCVLAALTIPNTTFAHSPYGSNPISSCANMNGEPIRKKTFIRINNGTHEVLINDTIYNDGETFSNGQPKPIPATGSYISGISKNMSLRSNNLVALNAKKNGFIISQEARAEVLSNLETQGTKNPYIKVKYTSLGEIEILKSWLETMGIDLPMNLKENDYISIYKVSCLMANYVNNSKLRHNVVMTRRENSGLLTISFKNNLNKKAVTLRIHSDPSLSRNMTDAQFKKAKADEMKEITKHFNRIASGSYLQVNLQGQAKTIVEKIMTSMQSQGYSNSDNLRQSFFDAGFSFFY